MKLFKYLTTFCLVTILIVTAVIIKSTIFSSKKLNPSSVGNNNLNQIHFLLSTSHLNPVQFNYNDDNGQISFYLTDPTDPPYKVIFSTTDNLYQQVSSLQKILKIAKMKQQSLKIIDLSLNHPYATFENN